MSSSRQWPGERHPTRWDVHDANESPAVTFLDRFRAALLHSEGAEEDCLLDSDSVIDSSENMNTSVRSYTYPMALLSDVPATPSEEQLERLQAAFFNSFKQHIFMNAIDVVGSPSDSLPPYLQFALACVGSMTSPEDACVFTTPNGTVEIDVAAHLFVAGVNLWSVMLEVDNRETRLLEAVVAAVLLVTYGVLSADRNVWRKSSGVLCNIVTISRRLHLTDGYSPIYTSGELPEKDFSMKSSLISFMLLTDIMQAVHCGLTPNYSTSELFIKMPSSNHQFRTIYNSLTHGYTVPPDVKSREDALLILTALLGDIIYMQRCHLSIPLQSDHHSLALRNPYTPLSSTSETSRLTADMMAALARWEQHFQQQGDNDIRALYYFTKVQLMCPGIWELPRLARYGADSPSSEPPSTKDFEIPDKAIDLAWLVFDNCDKASKVPERKVAIWLPIVLFMSSLVIWKKLHSQHPTDLKHGTLRVLGMFKDEIAKLPWPCCAEMTNTLDRLMKN
ncbi:hypothetical protein PV05_02619 [Exophiala xenobiotica]|uniref:Transcription factor domain-containing protein n=1 Tax=Exophiala xenobiotica TaxID=348802 RepID=A0A0D2FDF1_9EURO|nr:uncharacterized protein PV05_02619 [Exophiala xenobiotica]KIW58069.1 hypothetical protein PV05_02619 [Exophiala xenobiotica]